MNVMFPVDDGTLRTANTAAKIQIDYQTFAWQYEGTLENP